ncbi:UNVERIFIED_CONTAM: vancomycin resistance protein YoaR [Acetivibrio alkalicellulosi]
MLSNYLYKNKFKILLLVLGIILTIIVIGLFSLLNQKTFYKGISIEDIDVSDLDRDNAKVLIEKYLVNYAKDNKVVLVYEDRVWEIALSDISYEFLIDNTLENAYKFGREGTIINRLKDVLILRTTNRRITAHSTYSREQLINIVSDIKNQIERKERNASAQYINGQIDFEKEVIGQYIDVDKNVKIIENKILERDFSDTVLDVRKVIPEIVYEDISHIEDVISSFSTSFNPNKANRTYNIKLACERINNKLLMPGEEFSMDLALGTRTKNNGYKEAPVIIKNQLIEGIGGGVCQVTTTLYVAVLKAKLSVIERVSHSIPLGYVEPGQDATIAEGYIDFKFKNNKNYPILINAEVVGGSVVIRIIGEKNSKKYNVVLKSVIVDRINPEKSEVVVDTSLPYGKVAVDREAIYGIRVVVYRETYDERYQLVEREKISEDLYKPVQGKIRIGSQEP